jgi:hypothetical protein
MIKNNSTQANFKMITIIQIKVIIYDKKSLLYLKKKKHFKI